MLIMYAAQFSPVGSAFDLKTVLLRFDSRLVGPFILLSDFVFLLY